MSQTPRLEEIIEAAVNQRLESFFTAVPARLSTYDHDTQTGTVEIPVANAVQDGKGVKRWYHPTVHNVLVLFPGSAFGGEQYRITFPVGSAALGLYIVSTLDLASYRSGTDRSTINLEHASGATNHLSNGWFLPTEPRASKPSTPEAPTDAMVLHGPTVKIGGPTGTEPTIMGSTFKTDLNALLDLVSAFAATAQNTDGGIAKTALVNAINIFKSSWSPRLTTHAEVK